MQDSRCVFERVQKGPAIVLLLASVLSSFATDPVVELWERKQALLEKRHAFTIEQLEKVDQRAQRDAEGFLSKVETAPDDNAVISWAAFYPRLFGNEQAYDAYKKTLARMDVEGRRNVAGLSDESRLGLTQILTDAIKRAQDEDKADRSELLAELDEIGKDSDAFAAEREEYLYRNQALDNQRQAIRQQREMLGQQHYSTSATGYQEDPYLRNVSTPTPPGRMSGVTEVTPNAYGLGRNADGFGRPHTYRTRDGRSVGIFQDGVERDAYGAGVHADTFGRPVYDSQP
jgi:hypothetical protein